MLSDRTIRDIVHTLEDLPSWDRQRTLHLMIGSLLQNSMRTGASSVLIDVSQQIEPGGGYVDPLNIITVCDEGAGSPSIEDVFDTTTHRRSDLLFVLRYGTPPGCDSIVRSGNWQLIVSRSPGERNHFAVVAEETAENQKGFSVRISKRCNDIDELVTDIHKACRYFPLHVRVTAPTTTYFPLTPPTALDSIHQSVSFEHGLVHISRLENNANIANLGNLIFVREGRECECRDTGRFGGYPSADLNLLNGTFKLVVELTGDEIDAENWSSNAVDIGKPIVRSLGRVSRQEVSTAAVTAAKTFIKGAIQALHPPFQSFFGGVVRERGVHPRWEAGEIPVSWREALPFSLLNLDRRPEPLSLVWPFKHFLELAGYTHYSTKDYSDPITLSINDGNVYIDAEPSHQKLHVYGGARWGGSCDTISHWPDELLFNVLTSPQNLPILREENFGGSIIQPTKNSDCPLVAAKHLRVGSVKNQRIDVPFYLGVPGDCREKFRDSLEDLGPDMERLVVIAGSPAEVLQKFYETPLFARYILSDDYNNGDLDLDDFLDTETNTFDFEAYRKGIAIEFCDAHPNELGRAAHSVVEALYASRTLVNRLKTVRKLLTACQANAGSANMSADIVSYLTSVTAELAGIDANVEAQSVDHVAALADLATPN